MVETISVNLVVAPIHTPVMDTRFDQVQQLLLKFTKMEFGDRLAVSDKGDDLDAIIVGLNTLGEELEKKSLLSNDTNDRVNAILDVALKHTLMDFSVKAPVSTKGDELDAIAVGLNTLSEELEERIKALEESARKLESVNKELEAFSYSVSHDLRAPLRAVDGYAKMIEEDYSRQLDEEGRRMIRMMQYNAKKMGTLIDDLLAFSRLGRKEIQKSAIDMDELVAGALAEVSKSVDHRADVKIGKLHPIAGDYGLMNQVFVNLISNAVKYSSRAESPRVWISSEKKRKEVVYTITDNGVGFDMKFVNKLFGVFQRLHSMEEFEGTGVGLAIVQRIVNKHGGRVWAEGKKNEGASFHVSLPIEQ